MNHVHECVTGKLYAKLFSEKKTEKETREKIHTCDLHEYKGTVIYAPDILAFLIFKHFQCSMFPILSSYINTRTVTFDKYKCETTTIRPFLFDKLTGSI